MNWLLGHRLDSRKLCTVHDQGGRTLGYFIVTSRFHESVSDGKFKNITLGTVRSGCARAGSSGRARLSCSWRTRRAVQRRAPGRGIEIACRDDSPGIALRRLGFVAKGDLKLLFKAGPKSPLSQDKYKDRKNWWFRPADGDYFFFSFRAPARRRDFLAARRIRTRARVVLVREVATNAAPAINQPEGGDARVDRNQQSTDPPRLRRRHEPAQAAVFEAMMAPSYVNHDNTARRPAPGPTGSAPWSACSWRRSRTCASRSTT